MNRIGAALGHYLHLSAGRVVEVGRLVRCIDFEFFHAIRRSRHDAGGRAYAGKLAGDTPGRISSEARRIDVHTSVHIVGVVAPIELEARLINYCAGDAAIWTNSRLKRDESADVATETW